MEVSNAEKFLQILFKERATRVPGTPTYTLTHIRLEYDCHIFLKYLARPLKTLDFD